MSDERHEIEYAWQSDVPLKTQADVDRLTQFCLSADECAIAVERNDQPLPEGTVLPNEDEFTRRRQHRAEILARGEPDPYKAKVLESRMPPLFESDEQRATRAERQRTRSESYWQRFHERREKRILDAILGPDALTPMLVVKQPTDEEAAWNGGCQASASVRGVPSHGEEKTGRITWEATLHRCGEDGETSPESFVGKPVMNADRTKIVGRILGAERRGNWIVGTIEFEEGKAPQLLRVPFLQTIPAGAVVNSFGISGVDCQVGTIEPGRLAMPDESSEETWRDRPPML